MSATDQPGGRVYLRLLPVPPLADVELWWIDLDAYAAHEEVDGLPADERVRASAAAFAVDVRRRQAGRHALRSLLGRRLGVSPDLLAIDTDVHGKPRLRAHPVHFSTSRSGGEGVVALCADRPVGVDIEVVREVVDAPALARQHFTAGEYDAWRNVAAARADLVFLTCWTRKEACVKALGLGLQLAPRSFETGCETAHRRVAIEHDPARHELDVVSLRAPGRGIIAVAGLIREPPAC